MDSPAKDLSLGEKMEEEADTSALLKEAMNKGTSDSSLKSIAPAVVPAVGKGGRKRRRGRKTVKKVNGHNRRKTRKY